VNRGLTDSEKDQIIAKLKVFQGMETIDPAFDNEVKAHLREIKDILSNRNKNKKAFHAALENYKNTFITQENGVHAIHAKQLISTYLDSPLPRDTDTDGLYLREGQDYFAGEEQRKSFLDELTSWFKYKTSLAHHEVMTNGTPEKKQMSSKLKQATDFFLSPAIQKDLEILTLLRTSDLSFKQKDEFLQIFGNNPALQTSAPVEDRVLLDVLHPHVLTEYLFGKSFYNMLARDNREYTKYFTDGSDSIIKHDHELDGNSKVVHDNFMESDALVSPRFGNSFFGCGQDHVNHLKMLRLLQDYYGIDLNTEEGMATVDQLVHTYDISPGELTLERSQAIPMPAHTFDELPLMKFDGWEDSDVAPEPDRSIQDMDLSGIEANLNVFLKDLSSKTGEPVTLSSYKEKNKLTDYQYKVLRSVLHLEKKDHRRVEVMEKIWGTVLPQSELERLFKDQHSKFDESHH